MKHTMKTVVAVLATAILIVCVPQTADAANLQGSAHSPINLDTGGKYKKTWSKDSSEVSLSFKMQKQGYATITASRILDSKGRASEYYFYIYNQKGSCIWDCRTSGQDRISLKDYTYKVGLKAGKYTVKAAPRLYSSDYGKTSTISVKTTANSYWEVENNDSFETSTKLMLGRKFYTVYGENTFDKSDYFKVKLDAGKKYQIKIGNHKELFSYETLCKIYEPNMINEVKQYNTRSKAGAMLKRNGNVTIKAAQTGYYYIRLWNSFGYLNPGVQATITVKKVK